MKNIINVESGQSVMLFKSVGDANEFMEILSKEKRYYNVHFLDSLIAIHYY